MVQRLTLLLVSSCRAVIEDSLRCLEPSIRNVTVSLADRRVSIEHTAAIGSAEILKQLRRLGFFVGNDMALPEKW